MSERQRLPKLIEDNKLIHLKKEINGKIKKLLKENETDITDINHLMYAAATVITERITKPGKKVKNRSNKDSWKIRIQRQISNWRRELTESGLGSDNIKLNIKERKIFQKYKVTNAIEIAQLIEELKQIVQVNAQRMRRYEKRKTSTFKIKCSRKTQNNSTNVWEQKLQQLTTTHIWKKLSFTGSHYGKRKCNTMKKQIG
jgi:hypothetical protein